MAAAPCLSRRTAGKRVPRARARLGCSSRRELTAARARTQAAGGRAPGPVKAGQALAAAPQPRVP